jgi:hypothetical protein
MICEAETASQQLMASLAEQTAAEARHSIKANSGLAGSAPFYRPPSMPDLERIPASCTAT